MKVDEDAPDTTDVPRSNLWDSDDTDDSDSDSDEDGITERFEGAGKKTGEGYDLLSALAAADRFKEQRRINPYYPFSCKTEWDVVKWLSSLSVSMNRIDEYLKSDYVRSTE